MSDIIINRDVMPKPTEQSFLLSPRESMSPPRLWKGVADHSRVNGQLRNALSQQAQQLQVFGQTRRTQSPTGMFPFRIYQFPAYLRKFQNADDWQRFKVRSAVSPFYGLPQIGINGTDREPYPYQNTFLTTELAPSDATQISDDWHEIVVPNDGQVYYFWISTVTQTGGSPWTLMFGADPASATSMGDGTTGIDDKWVNAFANDPYHYLIGSVSISPVELVPPAAPGNTTIGANVPIIDQRRGDNFSLPISSNNDFDDLKHFGTQYCGTYDAGGYYWFGNEVTLSRSVGPTNLLELYSYTPGAGTAYPTTGGPIIGLSPDTNTPDPWRLISRSIV